MGSAFDIIVLDVMMPGESGFEFAADLRKRSQVPILMLTARGEPQDRVRGLEIGVDDYLSKPFEPRELAVADRLRAPPHAGLALGKPEAAVVRFGPFAFRSNAANCARARRSSASPNASARCCGFFAPVRATASPAKLLSGSGGAAQERTVDVLINRLRRKIEQDPANPAYLQTARGTGYRLIADG